LGQALCIDATALLSNLLIFAFGFRHEKESRETQEWWGEAPAEPLNLGTRID
jgi:hypothetical protein